MPVTFLLFILTIFWTSPVTNMIVHVLATISLPLILFSGLITLVRGNSAAKPFLIAWSFLIIGVTVFIGRSLGLISHSVLTSNSLVIAAAFEALLLSVALAKNIRKMYHERDLLSLKHKSLKEISIHDDLTGLYNKRYYEKTLSKLIKCPDRSSQFSIAVLDIDYFKKYNDSYGHLEGDTVLRVVGELFFDTIEETDIPCRYGGEEFVVIMPNTALQNAQEKAEELRKRVEELHFVTPKGVITQVTASIGVTKYIEGEAASQFFMRADEALYKAKENGRNCVVVSE